MLASITGGPSSAEEPPAHFPHQRRGPTARRALYDRQLDRPSTAARLQALASRLRATLSVGLQPMSFSLRATLICDDVRREDNGKLLFVGVYTPDIAVSQLPASLPLSAFQLWESDSGGIHEFRLLIKHVESGKVIQDGSATVDVPHAGPGFLNLRLGILCFEASGAYQLAITLDGQETPAGTHTFAVVLKPHD